MCGCALRTAHSTLGIRSSHNHPRSKTPSNWLRVRHTAVGYAKNRTSALVASAVTGVTTSINKGKVISPPPPANALIVPATIVEMKRRNASCVFFIDHGRSTAAKPTAKELARAKVSIAIGEAANRSARGARAPLPRQSIQIDVSAGQNDTDPLAADINFRFLNRSIWNCR